MIYEYEDADGNRLEVEAPMSSPPKHKIRRQGRTWRRVWSAPRIAVPKMSERGSFQGYGLPTREKHTQEQTALVDGWTETGHPCFENRAHADAWCRASEKPEARARNGGQSFRTGIQGEDAPSGKEVAEAARKGKLITE